MKNKLRIISTFMILILTLLFGKASIANSITKIINNVEIVNVCGIKLIKDVEKLNYKLVDIPEGINVLDSKIIHLGNIYRFKDNILLDEGGNCIQELTEDKYTLVLNTKELGMIYKIINRSDYGYKVLDTKIVYDKYRNTLDITSIDYTENDLEVTIFKNTKVGTAKLNSKGKGSIYINDMEDLTTGTYTIIIKKGSELLGVDAFHVTPIYKDLKLTDNVNFSIKSEISNKIDVIIDPKSGISNLDEVYVTSIYNEDIPNENLLLNLDSKKNKLVDLKGEIILKNKLNKGSKYRAKLKINGIDLKPQDDCIIFIKDVNTTNIKIGAVEKIGKDLTVDLTGVCNLNKDDVIEIVSLYDVNNKENNLITSTKLTNKVNEIELLNPLDSVNSYEVLIKINDFPMYVYGVNIVPVNLSKAIAVTDIISNKVFISLENTNGLKITDLVKVESVYEEGKEDKNLLKSEYNTKINNLNGTVFINQTLDTNKNYYVKFKINNVIFEEGLKITVNNDISLTGAHVVCENSTNEIKVSFINVDSINKSDLIEISGIYNIKYSDENLLDVDKNNNIINKSGTIYAKIPLLNENEYGLKIKINGVEFNKLIPITFNIENKEIEIENKEKNINENEKKVEYIKVEAFITEENNIVLKLNNLNILPTDKIRINSIIQSSNNQDLLSEKIENLNLDENNQLIIPMIFPLENNNNYLISLTCIRDDFSIDYNLVYINKLNEQNKNNQLDNKKNVNIECIEFGDGFLKFEHNLEKELNFNKAYCDISSIESRMDDKYIIVEKLIPYKKYKDIKIKVQNSRGALVEFNIPEFVCEKSKNDVLNYISKTYIGLKNGLNSNEGDLTYADEVEFWFWYNKLNKKEVDLRSFIFHAINENEFYEKYPNNEDKIKVIYKIIFGINPGEQSLKVWMNDFNKELKNNELEVAFKIVVEKMFTNLHFKCIEKKLK